MLAFLLSSMLAAPVPPEIERGRCRSAGAPVERPCTLPTAVAPPALAALLGNADQAWWMVGDRLTLIARPPEGAAASLCCAIQMPLEPIGGTDLQAITVRVPRADEALLDVMHLPSRRPPIPIPIRGVRAPPAPARAEPLAGRIETFQHRSDALGEERWVSVYLPPDIAPGEQLPLVYLTDQATVFYAPLAEAAAREGRARRAIVVGLSPGRGEIACGAERCDRRGLEYLLDLEGSQAGTWFARHMMFVADEIIPLIESRYPVSRRREDRIAAGHSNGASWALAAAAMRPDLFGGVIAMSSGSAATADAAGRLANARIYAGAGLFEPEFVATTERAADTARRAGADVRYRTFVGGHSRTMWEIIFADGIAWLLPTGGSDAH
ncbi:MAG TPA: alpha/beta hydrolase-fold protein [Allosphingosinicella sp.]|nr:alpha/beta hydrolase-fold protein [Allosphingosinicella sp.]